MYDVIREICNPMEQDQFNGLLRAAGIHRDPNLDYLCGVFDADEELAAAAGCYQNTIRCLAVRQDLQGEGLLTQMMSHVLQIQFLRGNRHVFLYTKPQTAYKMKLLGYGEIARTGKVVFMENPPGGFQNFCEQMIPSQAEKVGAVVMNANPFTLGHRYLVEQAAKNCDALHVFILSQDTGPIPAAVRKQLVMEGLADLTNVIFHETGPYLISSATFPSYFLPDCDSAIREQAELDVTVFTAMARKLKIDCRYVGREPFSRVTGIYNSVMENRLPEQGIAFLEIPRLSVNGKVISASAVRQAIQRDELTAVCDMLPESTYSFFSSARGKEICEKIRAEKSVVHY